jgi:hypothetical protein
VSGNEMFQPTLFDTASQNLAFSLGLAGKPETEAVSNYPFRLQKI